MYRYGTGARTRHSLCRLGTPNCHSRNVLLAVVLVGLALGSGAAASPLLKSHAEAGRAHKATVTGMIAAGGPAVPVTISTAGDDASLTFDGTLGQRVSVQATNSTISMYVIKIVKPDGTTLVSTGTLTSGSTYAIDATQLTSSGSYRLSIDPSGAATGSVTVKLNDIPPDFSGTITLGGAPVSVTTSVPGQNPTLTFSGTAGQRVSVSTSGSTLGAWKLYLLKPDMTALSIASALSYGASFLDTSALPLTGTYSLVVDPTGATTGSVTLTLYDVPPNFAGTITPGGPSVSVIASVPGQNPTLTFSGTAGQRVSLNMTNSTIGNFTTVSVKDPSGATLRSGDAGAGSVNYVWLDTFNLSVSGTYSIVVDPTGALTGQITATLYDVPADFTALIFPNIPVTATITVPGQNGILSFNGRAGNSVSLSMTNSTIGNFTTVSIKNPNGATLTSSSGINNFGVGPVSLPVDGTYTIVVDPTGVLTGQITVTLSGSPSLSGSIAISGNPVVGSTLSIAATWFGATSLSQQWYRCDYSGLSCAPIAGATAASYIPTLADVGQTLEVSQTASNSNGSTTAQSQPTQPVVSNALLLTYAPELRLDSSETYNPDSPGEMTDYHGSDGANQLYDSSGSVRASAAGSVPNILSLGFLGGEVYGDFASPPPSSSDKIDAVDNYASDYQTLAPLPSYANKMYARAVENDAGWTALQYWFFFYSNPKCFPLQDTQICRGEHEGDWEGIQVVLDPDMQPVGATYSQHDGAESCPWGPWVPLVPGTTHPVVYVAGASHASYFWAGTHTLDWGQTDRSDGQGTPHNPSVIDLKSAPGWLSWQGRWGGTPPGGVLAGASPTGPSQKGLRWSNPVEWDRQQAADGVCTTPPGSRLRTTRNAGAKAATASVSGIPPTPIIRAVMRGRNVVVHYRFKSWPTAADRRPWVLVTSVLSADRRIPRLTKQTRLTNKTGSLVQARGRGPGPFSLVYTVVSRKYTSTPARKVRVQPAP
jgi:Ig domain of plant-specific actin-binding protein